MAGTIILDASFIIWLEKCDAQRQAQWPSAGEFTPWQGLDRLMDAGFELVIPHNVMRELLFYKHPSRGNFAVGMGFREGVPFLDPHILGATTGAYGARQFGDWLVHHQAQGDVGLFTNSGDYQRARTEGHAPRLAIVSHERSDKLIKNDKLNRNMLYARFPAKKAEENAGTSDEIALPQMPNPGDGKSPENAAMGETNATPEREHPGDIEILNMLKVLRGPRPRLPILVLAHDWKHSMDIHTRHSTIAGNYRDYDHLLQLIGVDNPHVEPAPHWEDWFTDLCDKLAEHNLPRVEKFARQPSSLRSHVARLEAASSPPDNSATRG